MVMGFKKLADFIEYLRENNPTMCDEYEYDSVREFIESDPKGISELIKAFEEENDQGLKSFFATNILQYWPHKPSYVYLIDSVGLSPQRFSESRGYMGVVELRRRGEIE